MCLYVIMYNVLYMFYLCFRMFSYGEFKAEDQEKMLANLNRKVEDVYRSCIGDNEANIRSVNNTTYEAHHILCLHWLTLIITITMGNMLDCIHTDFYYKDKHPWSYVYNHIFLVDSAIRTWSKLACLHTKILLDFYDNNILLDSRACIQYYSDWFLWRWHPWLHLTISFLLHAFMPDCTHR